MFKQYVCVCSYKERVVCPRVCVDILETYMSTFMFGCAWLLLFCLFFQAVD